MSQLNPKEFVHFYFFLAEDSLDLAACTYSRIRIHLRYEFYRSSQVNKPLDHINFTITPLDHINFTIKPLDHINFTIKPLDHINFTIKPLDHINFTIKPLDHINFTIKPLDHINFTIKPLDHINFTIKSLFYKSNLLFFNQTSIRKQNICNHFLIL